ncbi:MAG TPA: HAD family hydrolase [Actinomycetota bacterium]|jgi:FMN phosphatase YigB (HAD superfamily)|nr:HAD family hydrolase [Actinomycetota bacterium]
MPTAYLLDLYDTLAHGDWISWREELASLTGLSQDQIGDAYERTRAARNRGEFESPAGDVAAILDAAGLDADLAERVLEAETAFGDRIELYDDVLPTLTRMRDAGHPTVIVSNCSWGTRATLERVGLDTACDKVVLSCEVGAHKPEAEIYRTALDALDVAPADALFIDDQTAYCDGARSLGIDTRLIQRPTASPFEGFAPTTNGHTVITGLAELLDAG